MFHASCHARVCPHSSYQQVSAHGVRPHGQSLDLIAQYPDITRERLAKEIGLSIRGVEKNLAQLKSEGKIVRIGGRKGGHWEVVKGKRSDAAVMRCYAWAGADALVCAAAGHAQLQAACDRVAPCPTGEAA